MLKSNLFFKTATLITLLPMLCACDKLQDMVIRTPQSQLLEGCVNGKISNTPVTCETAESSVQGNDALVDKPIRVAPDLNTVGVKIDPGSGYSYRLIRVAATEPPSPKPGPALVVFVEPGTWEANLENPDNAQELKDADIPKKLTPYIRTFVMNAVVAFLDRTFRAYGDRYDHVYWAQGDIAQDKTFMQAIDKATRNHAKVDILIKAHGGHGTLCAHPNIQNCLSSVSFKQFMQTELSQIQRDRVRAIFSTACHTTSPGANNLSMADAMADSFPLASIYGEDGVNVMAVHRDLVMFESYYKSTSWDFMTAFNFAYTMVTKNADGTTRTRIGPIGATGALCFDTLLGKKCVERTQVLERDTSQDYKFILSSIPKLVAHNGVRYTSKMGNLKK